MFTWLKRHLRDNRGDANVSRMTMIAIVFVVGAILLVMTTSAFRNPINRWFNKVQASWFGGDNGYYALNDPYILYEKNANGSIKGLNYRLTYSDGSYVEISAKDMANFPNGTVSYSTGGYYGGENEEILKAGWATCGTCFDMSDMTLSADGKTFAWDAPFIGYCEFTAYIPEP